MITIVSQDRRFAIMGVVEKAYVDYAGNVYVQVNGEECVLAKYSSEEQAEEVLMEIVSQAMPGKGADPVYHMPENKSPKFDLDTEGLRTALNQITSESLRGQSRM